MTTERKVGTFTMYFNLADGTSVNADLSATFKSEDTVTWEIETIHGLSGGAIDLATGKLDVQGFEGQVVDSVREENNELVRESKKLRKKNEKLKRQVSTLEDELGRFHATLANAVLEERCGTGSGRAGSRPSSRRSKTATSTRSSSPKSSP